MSAKQFLYEIYDILSKRIDKTIPDFVKNNLNPNFSIRQYQNEAFSRFFDYYVNYDEKEIPIHLLFNMATWSGKTLIMAWLILYLYNQWYRNFLFFVNSNNIIDKTKDNFLKTNSSKYLFNQNISFDWKIVNIQQVDNFEWANKDNINICFTTIQKLHSDLTTDRENSITLDDFKKEKIVLISDEAHHTQASTKKKNTESLFEEPSFENTVVKILNQNLENILLEFTATLDYKDKNIVEKYLNKVLYRYDLRDFRNAGYSKDIELLKSNFEKKDRIIQAIILNQYRQEVAESHNIFLKPVILFKANQTIEESKQNQKEFNEIIENLSDEDIDRIKEKTEVEIIKKAFEFFEKHNISNQILIQKLKINFDPTKCINVNEADLEKKTINKNDEQEVKQQWEILNSLEDKNNKIRAIFAVNKLNEWRDVLNLFDIVRLYDTRSVDHATPWERNKVQKQTMSEAQLIWRWARYRQFQSDLSQEKDKRKFDSDTTNELRILEQLHYHSLYSSSYISELKAALIESWLMDDNTVECNLNLKDSFKQTSLFETWVVYLNEKKEKSYDKINSFSDLWVAQKNIEYAVSSWAWATTNAFSLEMQDNWKQTSKDISLENIDYSIIQNALAKYEYFDFSNLKKVFPNLKNMKEFITSKDYLACLSITFAWINQDLNEISRKEQFNAVKKLLETIEKEMKSHTFIYEWTSEFKPHKIKDIFTDQVLNIDKNSERVKWDEDYLKDKERYAFNANFWTSEEKNFVRLMDRKIEEIKDKYENIYVIRNEKKAKLYNFEDWAVFEPDFIMYLTKKDWEKLAYQLFLEPKWEWFAPKDQWKEDFLNDIKSRMITENLWENDKIRITGVKFYMSSKENEFVEDFEDVIKLEK